MKEEEEPKKVVRSKSPFEERSVGEDIDQKQCRLSTDDSQIKEAENSDSKSAEVEEDAAHGQEHCSTKDCSEMREELKVEKLDRKKLMTSSGESEEEERVKRKKHASEDEGSDGEKVVGKKMRKQKKESKL